MTDTPKRDPNAPATLTVAQLRWLLQAVHDMRRDLHVLAGQKAPASTGASTIDLTTTDNDPIVRKNPKRWKGETCKGMHLSECPPEFLDVFAAAQEYKADLDAADEARKKWERGTRLLAAQARAWARHKRKNPTPAELEEHDDEGTKPDDDEGFED